MRVLVTGGAGRLGINVCKNLHDAGFQVRVFDLDTPRNRNNVKVPGRKADIFWGDVTKPDSVRRALQGVDTVVQAIHSALHTLDALLRLTALWQGSCPVYVISQMQ